MHEDGPAEDSVLSGIVDTGEVRQRTADFAWWRIAQGGVVRPGGNRSGAVVMSKILTVEYPDMLPESLHMSQGEFEREARLSMAVKLFEMGKLFSGQAAELAGIPRVHFLYELGRFGVSSIQVTDGELEEDVAAAGRAYDRHQHQPSH
jgi:predicted HTH domain antitoxin